MKNDRFDSVSEKLDEAKAVLADLAIEPFSGVFYLKTHIYVAFVKILLCSLLEREILLTKLQRKSTNWLLMPSHRSIPKRPETKWNGSLH